MAIWERISTLFSGRTGGAGELGDAENGAGEQRKLTDQEILLGRKGESHAASSPVDVPLVW